MSRARHSVRLTIAGFACIALMVLGGVTWATVAQVNLALDRLVRAHWDRVGVAMWRLDAAFLGAIQVEQKRPPAEYEDFFTPEQDTLWFRNGRPANSTHFVLRSPLCEANPWQDWIDLYFQVDQEGRWTSPQIPDDARPWSLASSWTIAEQRQRLREELRRLQTQLPFNELRTRVAAALSQGQTALNMLDRPERGTAALPEPDDAGHAQQRLGSEAIRRERTTRFAQVSSAPDPQCLPPVLADAPIPVDLDSEDEPVESFPESDGEPRFVEITRAPMTVFWLHSEDSEDERLIFVRAGYSDGRRFYQGFVANWRMLRDELLAKLVDDNKPMFPGANLVPVHSRSEIDPQTSELVMATIPARLVGRGTTPPTLWDAWRTVSTPLVLAWVAALVVLVGTGFGMANLLALTERRMQFAYAVTHELRTPLTTFRLYTDMLAAGLVPDESRQDYLETLNREAGRLSGLVEDVLEYARLENHKVRLNPVTVDGETLLQRISQDLVSRCHQIGIEAKTKNDIPGDRPIRTDVDLVHQITNVLINNACRHAARVPDRPARSQSTPPAVLLQIAAENGHLQVSVIDSGPGVARTDARNIFKPFRRGRNAEAVAASGIGLGLALARAWARLLNGRLELAARQDPTLGGAHFRLTVPSRLDA